MQIRDRGEAGLFPRTAGAQRETILASIQEQGKLTDELKARIEATLEKSELEDLYLPYKPKRRTKATIAREKGLEPLALYLWEQEAQAQSLAAFAATFVDAGEGSGQRGRGAGGRAPHCCRDDQRERGHPEGSAPADVGGRRGGEPQGRGRRGRAREVQDVLRAIASR